jgi:CRP-like cAMP-binding protein
MLITMVNSVNGMAHEMAAILGRCEVVNLQITRQKDCTATTSIQTVTPSPLPSNVQKVLPDVEKASLTGSIASSAPCVSTDTGYGAIQIGRSPDVMSVSSQFADNAGVSSRTTEDFDTSKKDKGDGKASFFEAQETKARTKDRFSLNSVGSVNPLIQYLPKPRERRTWKMAFKDVLHQLGGTPCSLGFNLRRLRISNTTDQKFEDIIQTLMNVRCSEAEDFNDVSTMLRDTRVEWSFFDIVEAGTRRAQYWVLAQYSILGHMIATTQAMIAYYSIWYVTLVCTFEEVLENDYHFNPESRAYTALKGVDAFCDVVYFLATFSSLRTTFIDHNTFVETCAPAAIWRRTVRSTFFWMDIASCVPLLMSSAFARLPVHIQLMKLLRLRCVLWWVFDLQNGAVLVMREYWQQILRLILFTIILGHLVGCFWYAVATPREHGLLSDSAGGSRWIEPANADRPIYLYYAYFAKTGLYLALGIIVNGHTVTENFLIVLLAPFGAVVSALILSAVVVIFSRKTAVQTHTLEQMEHLKQAIGTQGLPSSIQLRILAYHTQQRVQGCRAQTEKSIFRGLSSQLHFELNLVLYFNLIIEADIFKKSHPRVIRRIVLVFEDKLYLPGDFVCRYHDEGSEMYFIFKGLLNVISSSFVVLNQMVKGQHFGEISLLTGQRRTAYVQASMFCMLATLSKDNFDNIMLEYPQQLQVIMEQLSEKQRQWMHRLAQQQLSSKVGNTNGQRVSRMISTSELAGVASTSSDKDDRSEAVESRSDSPLEDQGDQNSETKSEQGVGVAGQAATGAEDQPDEGEENADESDDEDDSDDDDDSEPDTAEGSEGDEGFTEISTLLDLVSSRCSMALHTHSMLGEMLKGICSRQEKSAKTAAELNFTFERFQLEYDDEYRTQLVDTIRHEVDMLHHAIQACEPVDSHEPQTNLFTDAIGAMEKLKFKKDIDNQETDVARYASDASSSDSNDEADDAVL